MIFSFMSFIVKNVQGGSDLDRKVKRERLMLLAGDLAQNKEGECVCVLDCSHPRMNSVLEGGVRVKG